MLNVSIGMRVRVTYAEHVDGSWTLIQKDGTVDHNHMFAYCSSDTTTNSLWGVLFDDGSRRVSWSNELEQI